MSILAKNKKTSIYSDSDFDGVVSAALVMIGLGLKKYDPSRINLIFLNNEAGNPLNILEYQEKIKKDPNFKIICDLGYVPTTNLWFDHHARDFIPKKFQGFHDVKSQSSASLVYKYFADKINSHDLVSSFQEILRVANAVDSGNVNLRQVIKPQGAELLPSLCDISNHKQQQIYLKKMVRLLMQKNVSQILKDPEIKKRIKIVKKQEQESLKKMFSPQNLVHLNPQGFIIARFPDKFKASSYLPLKRYQQFQMVCFIYGHKPIVDVRVYANPVYKETFSSRAQNDYKNYDISSLPKNNGGGGHRGAGGFGMKKERVNEFIRKLIEIDKLGSWREKQKALAEIRVAS